jgi:hypothetical protein
MEGSTKSRWIGNVWIWALLALIGFAAFRQFYVRSEQVELKPSNQIEELRQAAAKLPPSNPVAYLKSPSAGPQEAEAKRVLKASLKEILDLRSQSDTQRQELAKTFGYLLTVASVDSVDLGNRMIDAVNKQVELDKRMAIGTANWMEHTRLEVQASALPAATKQAIWKSFTDNPRVFDSRKRTLEIEGRWATAVIDFYQFTTANRDHIEIKEGKVLFDSQERLEEYKTRFAAARNLTKQIQEAVAEQVKIQQEIEKETGAPVAVLQASLAENK